MAVPAITKTDFSDNESSIGVSYETSNFHPRVARILFDHFTFATARCSAAGHPNREISRAIRRSQHPTRVFWDPRPLGMDDSVRPERLATICAHEDPEPQSEAKICVVDGCESAW